MRCCRYRSLQAVSYTHLLIIAVFIEKNYDLATWQLLLVYLIPYLLIGHETLGEAAEGLSLIHIYKGMDVLRVVGNLLCQ